MKVIIIAFVTYLINQEHTKQVYVKHVKQKKKKYIYIYIYKFGSGILLNWPFWLF